ncbi:MAG: glycosyltransferase family 2 protein [Bacteroidota bacterium]
MKQNQIIAVIIPCYNEGLTIGKVVNDFQEFLPESVIYVYDNASTDNTSQVAEAAGAIVKKEPKKGKGNVVRTMYREVEADIFILIDGDDTYPVSSIRDLLRPILAGEADMVVGDRLSNNSYFSKNDRRFHNFGNRLVRGLINRLFNGNLKDIMSGYRVMNRYFIKNFPVMSSGFEIETEMTLHAMDKRFRIREIGVEYRDRPEGSQSKLNTISDGAKVIKTVFSIFKNYKPMLFFSSVGLVLLVLGLLSGVGPIMDYIEEQYVYKVPMAILATGLVICSMLCFGIGIILETVSHFHRMNYELQLNHYHEFGNSKNNIKQLEKY